jgi:hypothetical protein
VASSELHSGKSDGEDVGVRIAGRPFALSIVKPEEFNKMMRESFVSRQRSGHYFKVPPLY